MAFDAQASDVVSNKEVNEVTKLSLAEGREFCFMG